MVLKLERFSHISGQSFGLGSLIGFRYLLLVISLKVNQCIPGKGYLQGATWCPKRGPFVKAIESVSRPGTSNFSRDGQ